MSDMPPRYPAAGPVIGPLLELIDLLESSSCQWVCTCTCGWRSHEWDNEADANAEAWATHPLPCFGPYNAWCSCGWIGPKRIDRDEAEADWEQHRTHPDYDEAWRP